MTLASEKLMFENQMAIMALLLHLPDVPATEREKVAALIISTSARVNEIANYAKTTGRNTT